MSLKSGFCLRLTRGELNRPDYTRTPFELRSILFTFVHPFIQFIPSSFVVFIPTAFYLDTVFLIIDFLSSIESTISGSLSTGVLDMW